ncbi:MAG TPA: DUF4189 domain-containing protein [Dyella sp.]|uniref:DUF4189 domain-containing protein n=1 Tax=Dyella sp. TaxID=1869338 RepID=UPI002F9211C7
MTFAPRLLFAAFAATMSLPSLADTLPPAPPEIAASAPAGTSLIAFKTSGDGPDADAVAIYETSPDADDIRYRKLIIFGRKDGKFVPEVTNDKLIACSKCSQFHDDPFDPDDLKVVPGHIHIDQMDGGEKPSTTTFDFVRRNGSWLVTKATRFSIAMGRYESTTEKLPLPKSGLVQDMDGRWSFPVYLNTIVIKGKTNRFMFLHGNLGPEEFQRSIAADCKDMDCRVLIQQQDGCISLAQDSAMQSFGAGVPDHKAEKEAAAKAIAKCNAAGGNACKEVRTDCSKGVL